MVGFRLITGIKTESTIVTKLTHKDKEVALPATHFNDGFLKKAVLFYQPLG
jgi:hypothetical protein